MRRFFDELKRRKVYHVAVTYAVVAFVTLQAAALVFPATTLEGVYDVLVLVAFVGFPIAVVLAWALELTPDGIEADDGEARAQADRSESRSGSYRGLALFVLAGLVAASAYGAWQTSRPDEALPGETGPPSIAVMLFASLSPDVEDEYFAAGLSEELIYSLAHLEGLKVTGRSSAFTLSGAGLEAREIADSLGVSTVLEGSVRRSAGRIRVTAQLVDAESGFELWSGRFEREEGEVLAVQDSIVRAIVDALPVELGREGRAWIRDGQSALHPEDPEAYDLYLRGRHVWLERGNPRRALDLFRRAVDREPTYARAWAGVADAYTILGSRGLLPADEAHPAARAAAERALELSPDLGEAHASLGVALAAYYWDWDDADRHLRRAVELAPSYATAHKWQADLFSRLGRHEQAVEAARRAHRLDPLSEPARASLIHALRLGGRLDEALTEARRQRQVAPDYVYGHLNLGLVLLDMERDEAAARQFEQGIESAGRWPVLVSLLGAARARAGDIEAARESLAELDRRAEREPVAPIHRALVHAWLGESDAALDALEAGLRQRHWLMGTLAVEPMWEPLRDDARFRAVLDSLGLSPNSEATM